MKTQADPEQRMTVGGTPGLSTPRKPFRSQFGPWTKTVAMITTFSMVWQSLVSAAALDNLSWSAVRDSRAERRSGFFKPSEIKDENMKKSAWINQRNALANNLNAFNRKQAEINQIQAEQSKDVAKIINDAKRLQEQTTKEMLDAAEEIKHYADLGFKVIKAKARTVTLASGETVEIQKKTYMHGGQVIGVYGEIVEGRDGSISIRNTYNMQYANHQLDAQPTSYTSITYDTNTGMITESKWYDGQYWTEEDEKNDTAAGSDVVSGHRVKNKLSGYTEEVTMWYPPSDGSYDSWTKDISDVMSLDKLTESVSSEDELKKAMDYSGMFQEQGYREGTTNKTERTEMRYYTEEDEKENEYHIDGQMASYHEVRSSIEGRYSDAPALVTTVDWYGASYEWAYKDEDDRNLVTGVDESTEYIAGFRRTESEIENRQSVSLLTGFTEHSTDNLTHDTTRTWSSFIKNDGTWKMDCGYDEYGRIQEYKDTTETPEGISDSHRWDIQFWGWDDLETVTGRENWNYVKRWNYGQTKSYEEATEFNGGYYDATSVTRNATYYDGYGRLDGYQEINRSIPVQFRDQSITFDVVEYRDEGWVSTLMKEYVQVNFLEGRRTVIEHRNDEWDEYGQILMYAERTTVTGDSDFAGGTMITEVVRINHYKQGSYLLDGFEEYISERAYTEQGMASGTPEYATYTYHARYNMEYNKYNQLIGYDDFSVGLFEDYWFKITGGPKGSVFDIDKGAFPSFYGTFTMGMSFDAIASVLTNEFGEWGVATLAHRYDIGYNGINQMTDYIEDSWRFGQVEVEVPVLEDGQIVIDPVTGEVKTTKAMQHLDVRMHTVWKNAKYDDRGNVISYDQWTESSAMPGIVEYTEFRNGLYDNFGRQLGFLETTYVTGTYLDQGVAKKIQSVTSRERIAAYTKYNHAGQIDSYREIVTDPNGAKSIVWQTDTQYDFRNRMVAYVQETTKPGGSHTRAELTAQTYNKLNQVLTYHEVLYNFDEDGDMRSRTITDRLNTLYNSSGQAVYNLETSETFTGSSAISDNAYTTYRETTSPLDWLTGLSNVAYTEELDHYYVNGVDLGPVIVDYEILERDGENHVLYYRKRVYENNNGVRGNTVNDELVNNAEFDQYGNPLLQRRMDTPTGFDAQGLADLDWANAPAFDLSAEVTRTDVVLTEVHKSLVAELEKLNRILKPDLQVQTQTGIELYFVETRDDNGRPLLIRKVIQNTEGKIVGQEAYQLAYLENGLVDRIRKRIDSVDTRENIVQGNFQDLDDVMSTDLGLMFKDELRLLSTNPLEKTVDISFFTENGETKRRIRTVTLDLAGEVTGYKDEIQTFDPIAERFVISMENVFRNLLKTSDGIIVSGEKGVNLYTNGALSFEGAYAQTT
ncbi:MAG: hypothetical protein JW774_04375, partial [Candidatus Aureabacteria bacterium]|nr:hypothetical protein [Candidatus Auribacterota bacterium]